MLPYALSQRRPMTTHNGARTQAQGRICIDAGAARSDPARATLAGLAMTDEVYRLCAVPCA